MEGTPLKVRERGMPEVGIWQFFFDPITILDAMQLSGAVRDAVDFGCGYGTFTIPAAKRIRDKLHAFELDPTMIEATRAWAEQENVSNVCLHLRDFVKDGTGLESASVDYVMLFNILHAERPEQLLQEAYRILRPGGLLAIIHWNYDPKTPRGPPMNIRPRPEQCAQWTENVGFIIAKRHVDLPPYHYGIVGRKGIKP